MALGHPAWGQQDLQFLADGSEKIVSESETIKAEPGETLEAFKTRLRTAHGVTERDKVSVVYQADRPQYAIVVRGAYGA